MPKPNLILRYSDGRVVETYVPSDLLVGTSVLVEGERLFVFVQAPTAMPALFVETDPVEIQVDHEPQRRFIGQPEEK